MAVRQLVGLLPAPRRADFARLKMCFRDHVSRAEATFEDPPLAEAFGTRANESLP